MQSNPENEVRLPAIERTTEAPADTTPLVQQVLPTNQTQLESYRNALAMMTSRNSSVVLNELQITGLSPTVSDPAGATTGDAGAHRARRTTSSPDQMLVFAENPPPPETSSPTLDSFQAQFRGRLDRTMPDVTSQQLIDMARTLGEPAAHLLASSLTSDNYRERELAKVVLTAMGSDALRAVEPYLTHSSLEVSRRAGLITKDILRNTPPEITNHIGNIPAPLRDRLSGILNRPQIDQAGMRDLVQGGHHTAALVINQMIHMFNREGDAGLNSDRDRQLAGVLSRLGPEAAPAFFAALDSRRTPDGIRQLAGQNLDALARTIPANSPPDTWLRDYQGRTRRAGPEFSVDYQDGLVTRVQLADVIGTRTGDFTYQLGYTDADPAPVRGRTWTYRDANIVIQEHNYPTHTVVGLELRSPSGGRIWGNTHNVWQRPD